MLENNQALSWIGYYWYIKFCPSVNMLRMFSIWSGRARCVVICEFKCETWAVHSWTSVSMLGFLILVWICIFILFLFIQIPRPKNFPPGPRPLPLFGNLLELNINNPLKDFDRVQYYIIWTHTHSLVLNLNKYFKNNHTAFKSYLFKTSCNVLHNEQPCVMSQR